jgi:phosphatidylinositol alpha-1,6-mannosyltransferase
MKILLCSSEFPPGPGGIGRHAADLSIALSNKGHKIDVVSPFDYTDFKSLEIFKKSLPGEIVLIPFPRIGWATYLYRIFLLLKQLYKTKYTRIILTGTFPIWMGKLIKLVNGKNQHLDMFIHGSEINPSNLFKRWFTHFNLKQADYIWSVSSYSKYLLPPALQKQSNIQILPNGIHPLEWEGFNSGMPYIGWKGNPKLLTVGNLTNRKGQHRVVKALLDIIKVYPDAHYHMAGLPTNEKEIMDLARQLGVANHITIHGRLPGRLELASAYKTADVFIMLSENQADGDVEGFGIAILEANYFGLPAIGAKGCGIADAIIVGKTGELVDGNNPVEIVDAIKKIIQKKDSYSKYLPEWIQSHDWNNLVEKFIDKK